MLNSFQQGPQGKYYQDAVRQKVTQTNTSIRAICSDQILENRINQELELKRHQQADADVTEKIAIELSDLKRKTFVEEKKRQQLRERNHELRELEAKLRAAYVSKALAAQLAEREALRRQEKDLERKEIALIEKARIERQEYEQRQLKEERNKKMNFRKDLLSQMQEMQQRKAKHYEDFLIEKAIIDEIVRKIYEEQLEEMREKLARKIKFKEEMDEFLRSQQLWKEKQRQETEEENKRFIQIMDEKEKFAEEKERIRKMQLKIRQDISEKIGNNILEIESQKRKRQENIQDLHVAERKALDEEKLRENVEKTLRERIITRLQLEVQKDEIKRRQLKQQEEDKRFKEEQLRAFAKSDELEKIKEQSQQQKRSKHRQAIQDCLEEKKRRRAEQFMIILKEREQDFQEEKRKQELIEEERIRMLKEHATALLGYLPTGVLKESDYEHLPLPPKN